MSSKGVVHVKPGSASEFISLSDWMREAALFNMLRSIRFFRYSLETKAFRRWCRHLQYQRYCRWKRALTKSLFIARLTFCKPLMQVRELVSTFSVMPTAGEGNEDVVLLDTSSTRYEITKFAEAQEACRNRASKHFETTLTRISEVVQAVCADVKKRARANDGMEGDGDSFGAFLMGKGDKSKPMNQIKQEAADKARALRIAQAEEAQLGELIRAVDNMCVESLVGVVVRSLRRFLMDMLDEDGNRNGSMFTTQVIFDEHGTSFAPGCKRIKSTISAATDAMVTTATTAPRILSSEFREHTDKLWTAGETLSAPSVLQLVSQSEEFYDLKHRVEECLEADFNEAERWVKHFDNVRPIYDFHLSEEFRTYPEKEHTMIGIKRDMEKVKEWQRLLAGIGAQHQCGCILIEFKKLKTELTDITEEALAMMKEQLKKLARDKCREVVGKLTAAIKVLEERPAYLKDFARYMQSLRGLQTDDEGLNKKANLVHDMYRLLDLEKVAIPPQDEVQLLELGKKQTTYRTSKEDSTAYVESKRDDMVRRLKKTQAQLNKDISSIAASVSTGEFINPKANAPAILESLEDFRKKLAKYEEDAATYAAWAALLEEEEYEAPTLASTKAVLLQRSSLWQASHRFNTLYKEWTTKPVKKVDAEGLANEVNILMKAAFLANKKLGDEVSAQFKERISHFKLLVTPIQELCNPAMKERHWAKLYKELGQTWIEGNESVTLKELMSYDVFSKKEAISEVSGAATGEARLEASLRKIAAGWEEQSFVTRKHRDQRNVFILGKLHADARNIFSPSNVRIFIVLLAPCRLVRGHFNATGRQSSHATNHDGLAFHCWCAVGS